MNHAKHIAAYCLLFLVAALCSYAGALIVAKSAAVLCAHWPAIRTTLTHLLFWGGVILIARLLWHLGSSFKQKEVK